MIIDENQLSCAYNILRTTKLKNVTNKNTPPNNNRPKQLLLKASPYLSIRQHFFQQMLFTNKRGMSLGTLLNLGALS